MLLALLLAASSVVRPFPEERLLLDRRLETLRRILPDGANPTGDAALLKELAENAHLLSVESLARPPLENGARGDVAVDVSGVGRYADIDRFFRQVALSHRLIDVESLTLTAAPGDTVRLTAVLKLPFRPLRAPLPQPPDGTRARTAGLPRPQADAFVLDQALALAKSDAIAALRRTRRNPRVFLSELSAVVRDRPVLLTNATLADEFVIRGLTIGEASAHGLESRLERGFFRLSQFLMTKQGACLRFEARGVSPVAGPDAELPLPTEDPFEEQDASCAVDRDAARVAVVRGPNAKRPGQGPLSLRLRDMDLADVFRVLHGLTGQAFLVEGDVVGRVHVDLSRVTLEEALAALAKAANLRVEPPALVRRVWVARGEAPAAKKPTPAPKGAPTPEPIPASTAKASFELKRASLRDILAVMTDADPALASLGPPGSLGKATLWARETPLAALRSAVLESAGLSERVEEDHRVLSRPGGAGEPPTPIASESEPDHLVMRAPDLSLLEFEPAGLASAGSGWMAYAYSPAGALLSYRSGERLANALVKDVQSTDVLLETDEGELRVSLAALPQ
jgi:hypothetical protein